jgi:hypothetical protein
MQRASPIRVKWVGCRPLRVPSRSLLTLIYVICYRDVDDFVIVIISPPASASGFCCFFFSFVPINAEYFVDVTLSYLLEELQRIPLLLILESVSTISDLANMGAALSSSDVDTALQWKYDLHFLMDLSIFISSGHP